MSIKYISTGMLTDAIEHDNYDAAQAFLTKDDMTPFMDESIAPVIESISWSLSEQDCQTYMVTAFATRELNEDELRVLSEWTSGQNSDGLGESFEQQEFAWVGPDSECGMCDGCEEGYDCDEMDEGAMVSFDWKLNRSVFSKINCD